MSREHRETFEDFDLERADHERRVDRDLEQREWEEEQAEYRRDEYPLSSPKHASHHDTYAEYSDAA